MALFADQAAKVKPTVAAPAAPAKPAKADAGAVPAEIAGEQKPPDPALIKATQKLEKLKKELEGLTKGTPAYDLKQAEVNRAQREVQAAQRKQQEDQLEERISGGAALDTDSYDDELLDRAREYAEAGAYRHACDLWQHVLNRRPGLTDRRPSKNARSTSFSPDVYLPRRDLVEMELSALPPEGLREYRLTADAEARALLAAAEGEHDADALSKIVDHYFISSFGDEAAYRLACVRMDESDFISARRLLEKVATRYPDPSVNRADLLLRLALAHAKSGDDDGAREAMGNLEKVAAAQSPVADLVAAVREVVAAGPAAPLTAGPVRGWPMALGTSTRDGVMAGLPGPVVTGEKLWIDQEVMNFDFKVPEITGRHRIVNQQGTQGRQEIVTRWESGGWTPTAQVLLHDGVAFCKTHSELRWYDIKTRKLLGSIAQPTSKPDNSNGFFTNFSSFNQKPDAPTTSEEIAMFGDRVAKSMTLHDGTLYHIEGRIWQNDQLQMWANNGQTAAKIVETLCAVDITEADNGKRVKWRFPTESDETEDMRFVAPPVPSGPRMLVPAMQNSELYLIALDAATGKQVWKTLVCMPGVDDGSRWATVGVSVIGSEAYVATGYGVVVAMDVSAGNLLWASRYKRSELSQQTALFRGRPRADLPGWSEDVIIPREDRLIVLPSDGNLLFCFSRLSGRLLWHAPRDKATYALGVLDDSLYVAGTQEVRRYGLRSGKLEKEAQLTFKALGRGALTPQGVYLPSRGEIIRLDVKDLAPAGKLRVATTSRDPVGNLFCDGDHLVAAGLDRVYLLSDGDVKMRELSEALAAHDSGPLRAERAFLHQVLGKTQAAVDDLRKAYELLPAGKERDESGRKLMLGLLELSKSAAGETALSLFDEAERVATPLKQQVRVWLARGRHLVKAGDEAKALDLFLKAAQDESDALVVVDETGGRRETRASLAAGAEIRALVLKEPALKDELTRRGEAALKPYLELEELERHLADPGEVLPQTAAIQQMESQLPALEKARNDAQAAVAASDARGKAIEASIAAEKKSPAGKLEALQKQLAEHEATAASLREKLTAADKQYAAAQKQTDDARAHLAGLYRQLQEVKSNRVASADQLLALGDLYPASQVQLKAHVLAARYLWNEDLFERAELVLRDLSQSTSPPVAAAGAVALAQGYQAIKWDRQAQNMWSTVRRDYADVDVDQDGAPVKAGDLATAALASIKVTGTGIHVERRMPDPPYEKAWGYNSGNQYLLDTDDVNSSQFLEDHLLLVQTRHSRIACKNVETGNDVWHLSLDRDNYSGSSTANGRILQFNGYAFSNGGIARQAHLAMLASADRIMVVGLTSGKKLWDSPGLEPVGGRNPYGFYSGYSNPMEQTALGSGVIAEFGIDKVRDETIVRARDVQTGKVRWLCEFSEETIAGLAAAHGYVFVFVNSGNEIIICDAVTGERTGRIKLENRQMHYPIAWTRHGVLAVNMKEATLYDLPSGKQKWTASLRSSGNQVIFSGYQRIDPIGADRVCVLNGGMFIIDLKDGKVVAEANSQALGSRYFNDVATTPDGTEIVAIGYSQNNEQTITLVDAKSGKVKSTIALGPRQQVQANKVAAAGDLIPAILTEQPKTVNGRRIYTQKSTLALYRKSDGKRVALTLPGGPSTLRLQSAHSPIIRGNFFIVMTSDSISAYRRTPGAPAQELKEHVAPAADETKDDEEEAEEALLPPGVRIRAIKPAPVKPAPAKEPPKKDAKTKDANEKKAAPPNDKKGADAGAAGGRAVIIVDSTVTEATVQIKVAPQGDQKAKTAPQEQP